MYTRQYKRELLSLQDDGRKRLADGTFDQVDPIDDIIDKIRDPKTGRINWRWILINLGKIVARIIFAHFLSGKEPTCRS